MSTCLLETCIGLKQTYYIEELCVKLVTYQKKNLISYCIILAYRRPRIPCNNSHYLHSADNITFVSEIRRVSWRRDESHFLKSPVDVWEIEPSTPDNERCRPNGILLCDKAT